MRHVLYGLFVAVLCFTMLACKAENGQLPEPKDCDNGKCVPDKNGKCCCGDECGCCSGCDGKDIGDKKDK